MLRTLVWTFPCFRKVVLARLAGAPPRHQATPNKKDVCSEGGIERVERGERGGEHRGRGGKGGNRQTILLVSTYSASKI